MEKLTPKEEEILQLLWEVKKGFVKDLLARMPDPKPHYNTLSTIIRNLEEKGYVAYTAYGTTYEYYPLISKEQYKESSISKILSRYFDNSYKNLVAFFAQEEKISAEELKEILEIINKQKQD
jgi:BlaI family transcriptional regulator, penicillinase repressor